MCFFAGRVFNGSGNSIDKGPPVLAEDFLDIQGDFICCPLDIIVQLNLMFFCEKFLGGSKNILRLFLWTGDSEVF